MGRAEDLFERIQRHGSVAIDELIASKASEELFLDFKRSADHGANAKLDSTDLKNLRKAICGFANSEGGVVVWGVDCSRSSENGDVASSKQPITNPQRFVSWLEGMVSGSTIPPVVGVRSIPINGTGDSGFVVTYVPQSRHAPHQLAGESKYLIRAGSDFVPAPHGVVAGLFGRAPNPVVFPNFALSPASISGDRATASVTVMLVNDGQVVAEDLFLSLIFKAVPGPGQSVTIHNKVGWPTTTALNVAYSWVCPREFRLAPRGFVNIASVTLSVPRPAISDFSCVITAGCRHAIPYTTELMVDKASLDAEIDRLYRSRDASVSIDLHKCAQALLGIEDPLLQSSELLM